MKVKVSFLNFAPKPQHLNVDTMSLVSKYFLNIFSTLVMLVTLECTERFFVWQFRCAIVYTVLCIITRST